MTESNKQEPNKDLEPNKEPTKEPSKKSQKKKIKKKEKKKNKTRHLLLRKPRNQKESLNLVLINIMK